VCERRGGGGEEIECIFPFFQLVILMALAKGRSVVRSGPITLHTRTAIHVAEMMTKVRNTHNPTRGAEKSLIINILVIS
jgi:RNA 3'-terminal phosphate cyclase